MTRPIIPPQPACGDVDSHAHIRPTADIHDTQAWAYLANLAFGVTTTRDPQTGVSDVLTYADLVRSGRMIGPRVYSTGPGIFGSYQGESIRNLEHARDILRRYAQYYGTQTFKMYLAGNRQQRQWLIMAARELGLMPTTEAGIDFAPDLTNAMDGYPGIEHNLPVQPLYDDVVRLFAETQVVNTPTLIVNFGGPMGEIYWFTRENVHDHERLRRFTPHETLDARTRRRAGASGAVGWAVESEFVFEEHARFPRDIVARGGMAGIGSHGQLQGLGYHWEMWMLASGGMSNHDVLRAATIFGANAIGLEKQLGSLEVGSSPTSCCSRGTRSRTSAQRRRSSRSWSMDASSTPRPSMRRGRAGGRSPTRGSSRTSRDTERGGRRASQAGRSLSAVPCRVSMR